MEEFGYSKIQLGAVLSIGSLVYGFGKAIAGYIGDRISARTLMAFGLFMSAVMSFFMGQGYVLAWFMVFWILNNCFQSFGWPPCARLLNHWYSPKELATKWALWNSSQQIGGGLVLLISPFIIDYFGWRYVFFIPGAVCIAIALFLYNRLRDTPESLGLPSIEEHHGLKAPDVDDCLSQWEILKKYVITNKLVWYVCFANFFVYFVRMTFFQWAPLMLKEAKGSSLYEAAMQTAIYDIAGIFGGLLAGYLSDKIFKGYRGRVSTLFMLMLSMCIFAFWKAPSGSTTFHFFIMLAVGFFITGPQVLVGVAASDFTSKRAAGTATGLTGTFGYIGSALSGIGVGTISEIFGWDTVFLTIIIAGLLGALFFSLTLNHRSRTLDARHLDLPKT
jgi:OPA family glycerol-3-phosphate transporter-like MFS transporter